MKRNYSLVVVIDPPGIAKTIIDRQGEVNASEAEAVKGILQSSMGDLTEVPEDLSVSVDLKMTDESGNTTVSLMAEGVKAEINFLMDAIDGTPVVEDPAPGIPAAESVAKTEEAPAPEQTAEETTTEETPAPEQAAEETVSPAADPEPGTAD